MIVILDIPESVSFKVTIMVIRNVMVYKYRVNVVAKTLSLFVFDGGDDFRKVLHAVTNIYGTG